MEKRFYEPKNIVCFISSQVIWEKFAMFGYKNEISTSNIKTKMNKIKWFFAVWKLFESITDWRKLTPGIASFDARELQIF